MRASLPERGVGRALGETGCFRMRTGCPRLQHGPMPSDHSLSRGLVAEPGHLTDSQSEHASEGGERRGGGSQGGGIPWTQSGKPACRSWGRGAMGASGAQACVFAAHTPAKPRPPRSHHPQQRRALRVSQGHSRKQSNKLRWFRAEALGRGCRVRTGTWTQQPGGSQAAGTAPGRTLRGLAAVGVGREALLP